MDMRLAYEHYFQTSHYDERYPRPNRSTLGRVQRLARPGSSLLDIGAGNGRYAIPLALRGYKVIAVERSDTAREQLAARVKAHQLKANIVSFKDLQDVDDDCLDDCRLALLLFGVLGHMSYDERHAALTHLRKNLSGRAELLGSVPNRLRRFGYEQKTALVTDHGAAPRFKYSRNFGGGTNTFEYTAFSTSELRTEFQTHGWECTRIISESLLSETAVTRNKLTGTADAIACHLLPPSLGYNIFFHARAAA